MPRPPSIEPPIDGGLQLLNPHPDGKVLSLHGDLPLPQEPEGIPGAVAHSQDQMGGGQLHPVHPYAGHPAALQPDALKGGAEPHLSPAGDDLPPEGGNDPAQQIGADMGLGSGENLPRGSMAHQLLQHIAAAAVGNSGGQLSVGKSARPSLAELDVGSGIQDALLPEPLDSGSPLINLRAPFQYQGAVALKGQGMGGKDTRRTKARNHDGPLQLCCSRRKGKRWAGLPDCLRGSKRLLRLRVFQLHRHGDYKTDPILPPGIQGFLVNRRPGHLAFAGSQLPERRPDRRRFVLLKSQRKVRYNQHERVLLFSEPVQDLWVQKAGAQRILLRFYHLFQ